MRTRSVIGGGIVFWFLTAMSGCAFDGDDEQADSQAPDEGSASADLDDPAPPPPATPTCDWVASFAGAWVPFNRASNTVNCNMVRGDNSPGVGQLQQSMNLCYQEHLARDNDFGGNTEAALRRTQTRAGTTSDGQYGPNTRKAMLHERIGGGCIRVP